MAFETVRITSTKNAATPIVGFRDDVVAGDVILFSLTSMVGVTSIQWDLLGRPEGSVAGGTGVPSVLAVGATAGLTVDADTLPARADGSYKVQATINPGSPSQTRKTVVVARPTGLSVVGLLGAVLPLRRLAAYETDEDTSVANVLAGWATQLNRWLFKLAFLQTVAKTAAYNVTELDDIVFADATGGAFSVTLPTAVGRPGRRFTVKRMNTGANAVTIASTAGTIDGAATVVLAAQYAARTVVSDGTNWRVVSTV